MPVNEAFSLVLQVSGLNYYIKDNTLVIISKNNSDNAAFSRQEMMIFPVQYVSASSVADFLNKNVFGMQKPGISGVEAATVNSATNEVIVFGMPSDADIVRKIIAQLDKEPLNKTYTLSHTTPKEMADMICNMLLPAHGSSSGMSGGSGKGKKGKDGFVTGGASSSKSDVDNVVLGEGVVACQTSQGGTNASGNVAFDAQNIAIAYYPTRGTIMMIGGSVAQQNMIEEFIRTNDIKQRQAYLEMSIVELNEEGSKEFQNNWSLNAENWGVSFNN
jgi:type II secretory pathway component GspD/PulD (secretin)